MTTVSTSNHPLSGAGDPTPAVVAISPTMWRVSDPRAPEGVGRSELGLVQTVGEIFEVTRVGKPFSRYYFGTLDDAVSFLGIR